MEKKASSGLKKFLWGFLVGVIATVLFFYFGGFTTLSRQGEKVEKQVKKELKQTIQQTTEAVGQAKDKTKEAIKEKLE